MPKFEFLGADEKCSVCKRKLDAVTNMAKEQRLPEPGDLSVCLYCGETTIFGDDMCRRAATVAEILLFSPGQLHLARQIRKAYILGQNPSEQQVVILMSSSNSGEEWDTNARTVKAVFNGKYPAFWWQAIMLSGVAARTAKHWQP